MTIKKKIEKIIGIIEEIELYYIKLSELEIMGELDSFEYKYYFQLLSEAINKEKELLSEVVSNGDLKIIIDYLNKLLKMEKTIPNILNHSYSSYFRLRANLEGLVNEASLDYANALNYDITNIILNFLSHLINNPYYEILRVTVL